MRGGNKMDHTYKYKKLNIANDGDSHDGSRINKCAICGHRFKSRSHIDVLCNICWADNEMKAYLTFGGFRKGGMIH